MEQSDANDFVVVAATLGDESLVYGTELNVGTGQGGADGDSFEVIIDWEPVLRG